MMVNKISIPSCVADKIDFTKIHSQDDLNTAISQAYSACAVDVKAECDCAKGGKKKKREPSEYNKFIKSCFGEKKKAGEDVSRASVVLSQCAANYRKEHPKK